MTRSQFIKKYRALSETDKRTVKEYHENMLKNAIFIDTFNTAEKILLWIRDAEKTA